MNVYYVMNKEMSGSSKAGNYKYPFSSPVVLKEEIKDRKHG